MENTLNRKALFAITLGLGALSLAAPAMATGDHHEETDGCDHGATGKECREDPSDNGKDCEVHGNHGGVNEDHCDSEEPTSTTTTTAPGATTTTTSTLPGTPTTSTTTGAPVTTTTLSPTVTTTTPSPSAPVPTVLSTDVPTTPIAELPHTGSNLGLFLYGLTFTVLGALLYAASKFRRNGAA